MRDNKLERAKGYIRTYLREIPDEALWQLCAMAKDGQIEYLNKCKCMLGIVGGATFEGYRRENTLEAIMAESGLNMIGCYGFATEYNSRTPEPVRDRYRNLRLLPMVRYEMKRRTRQSQAVEQSELITVGQ